jgi:hypothetical protein
MKVLYKSPGARFTVEFTEDAPNKLFESIARFQEVFEKNNSCLACGGEEVYFNVRKVEKSKFYEKKCANPKCGAALTYHSNEEGGGLYTTWKDKWTKWVPTPKEDDAEVFDEKAPQVKKVGK